MAATGENRWPPVGRTGWPLTSRLLELAPEGVREIIRAARYRPREYTHEVVVEIYAMLIGRRHRDLVGRPEWLNDELYTLVMRVIEWTE